MPVGPPPPDELPAEPTGRAGTRVHPGSGAPAAPDPAAPGPAAPDLLGAAPAGTDRVGAGSSGSGRSQGSVRRELVGYTALRLGLIAVLSVAAHLTGLLWLPSIALGTVAAALLSLLVLRRPMRRLAAAMAGRSQATARLAAAPGASSGLSRSGAAAYDPYEDDPYQDDDDEDHPDEDHPDQQVPEKLEGVPGVGAGPARGDREPGQPGQEARTRARPTSSP